MKKILYRLLPFIVLSFVIFSSYAVSANQDLKLQLYFEPQIMNNDTGEIVVDVNIRNVDASIPKHLGDICSVIFSFEYDVEHFDAIKAQDGNVKFIVDDNTLIKSVSDIEVKTEGSVVGFRFIDSTLQDNLIGVDGTLCRFSLCSKEIKELWNSFDKYPIRFIPGSVGVVTYHLPSYSVGQFYNMEAIDGNISGYNALPDLTTPTIDKHITFTAGEAAIDVNGEKKQTDATPFIKEDVLMIPIRYFAESIGMDVEWNEERSMSCCYAKNKTLSVSLMNNTMYVNAIKLTQDVSPVEIDGRVYIPVSSIEKVYSNAQITFDAQSATIYVP